MPTPGGLFKAGDKLYHDSDENVIYTVLSRTSSSAPYSLRIKRDDGKSILGFSGHALRNRGYEAMLSLETGRLPRGWHFLPEDAKLVEPKSDRPRARRIQVRPSTRRNPGENEQAEIVLHANEAQSTAMVMSDHEVLELIIQASQYLRDKAEGMFK